MKDDEKRHQLVIPIFIKSENAESVLAYHSHSAPKGKVFRLNKKKDELGAYVIFKCRKIYEENWVRVR